MPDEQTSSEENVQQAETNPIKPSCSLCGSEYSTNRLKHRCRVCHASVCSECSETRLRLRSGEETQRACDKCAAALEGNQREQVNEAFELRLEMITSLKHLLKEKYEEIEGLKEFLVKLVEGQFFLQESPSIRQSSRFSSAMGLSRINFGELVLYVDQRVKFLRNRLHEIKEATILGESQLTERRRNFGFLCDRTEKAESDASRVSDLVMQRDRLRNIYTEQSTRLSSFKDRIELLELQSSQQMRVNQEDLPPGVVVESEYIGDLISESICPCLG